MVDALAIHGRLKDKRKKREKGRYKSYGRPKSFGQYKDKCWNCGKVGHLRRDYKEEKNKNNKEKTNSKDEFKKYSQEDGGDAIILALATHAG